MAVFSRHLLWWEKQIASKMADKTIKMVFCLLFLVFFDTVKYLSGIKQSGRVKEHFYYLI